MSHPAIEAIGIEEPNWETVWVSESLRPPVLHQVGRTALNESFHYWRRSVEGDVDEKDLERLKNAKKHEISPEHALAKRQQYDYRWRHRHFLQGITTTLFEEGHLHDDDHEGLIGTTLTYDTKDRPIWMEISITPDGSLYLSSDYFSSDEDRPIKWHEYRLNSGSSVVCRRLIFSDDIEPRKIEKPVIGGSNVYSYFLDNLMRFQRIKVPRVGEEFIDAEQRTP